MPLSRRSAHPGYARALDFESNKVEMGKQLYEVCADKGNFFNVYSVFTFDNYKEQLMEYVTNK